jgi:hypothetical protein
MRTSARGLLALAATLTTTALISTALMATTLVLPAASAAQFSMLTQEQISGLLLTQGQVVKATKYTGKLKRDASNSYCSTNGTYNICMESWKVTGKKRQPAYVSLFSMPSRDVALTTLAQYVQQNTAYGWRPVSVSTNPVVMVMEGPKAGRDVDEGLVMLVKGSEMIIGSCQRRAAPASVGPLVKCAKALATAQTRRVP